MIGAGRLRFVATRMTAATAQDALGGRDDVYTAGSSFRCDLRDQGASETAYADGVAVIRNFEVRARWNTVENVGLTEIDRLSVRGKTLRIEAITNLDEADRLAVIQCVEVD